jgi:hypothetical protein
MNDLQKNLGANNRYKIIENDVFLLERIFLQNEFLKKTQNEQIENVLMYDQNKTVFTAIFCTF